MLESVPLSYTPTFRHEEIDRPAMLALLRSGQDCFDRKNPRVHFTGSDLLLNQHKFLNMRLQFGGHADGNPDTLNVTRREVAEKSGFDDVVLVQDGIFDLSIHAVPENPNKGKVAPLHCDIRYPFRLNTNIDDFKTSDESLSWRWCRYDEAVALTGDGSVKRTLDKW
jgi:hypothetical protein